LDDAEVRFSRIHKKRKKGLKRASLLEEKMEEKGRQVEKRTKESRESHPEGKTKTKAHMFRLRKGELETTTEEEGKYA